MKIYDIEKNVVLILCNYINDTYSINNIDVRRINGISDIAYKIVIDTLPFCFNVDYYSCIDKIVISRFSLDCDNMFINIDVSQNISDIEYSTYITNCIKKYL